MNNNEYKQLKSKVERLGRELTQAQARLEVHYEKLEAITGTRDMDEAKRILLDKRSKHNRNEERYLKLLESIDARLP